MSNLTTLKKRKIQKGKSDVTKVTTEDESDDKKTAFKYGPLPRFPAQRVWSRGVLVIGVSIYIWFHYSLKSTETALARQKEVYDKKGIILECDQEFIDDVKRYPGCFPRLCGRYVSDKIVTAAEADALLKIATKVMAMGGSSGGATVMDLNSGALSYNDKFINAYMKDEKLLTPADRTIFRLVKIKIQNVIAETFNLDFKSLHVTQPLFFSRLTALDAKIPNDEYWHPHIDKQTYESFHYTSLIYLNDYNMEFHGGRFIFMNNLKHSTKNITVEPRKGRVLFFTSGAENVHYVERVTDGMRFAMTVPFTCDQAKSINNPQLQ